MGLVALMENCFQSRKADFGSGERNYILIPRKPSQVPVHIDRQFMDIGCIGHLDGPNNRVIFEFFSEEGFEKAKAYLALYEWVER